MNLKKALNQVFNHQSIIFCKYLAQIWKATLYVQLKDSNYKSRVKSEFSGETFINKKYFHLFFNILVDTLNDTSEQSLKN